MQIVLPAFYIILFIITIRKWTFFNIPSLSQKVIIGIFLLKIFAGVSLWWIYNFYYSSGDINLYYGDSIKLFDLLFKNPKDFFSTFFSTNTIELNTWHPPFQEDTYNTSKTIVLFNVLVHFFSFGNFHVHTIFMCFISLIGLTLIYKSLISHFQNKEKWLLIIIYFIPTVLFWSSGVLKEGLLITGIGLLFYTTNYGKTIVLKPKPLILFLTGYLLILATKPYIALIITPALFSNLLFYNSKKITLPLSYLIFYGISCCLIYFIGIIQPNYNILNLIKDKQAKSISESKGGYFLVNKNYFVCIDYEKRNQLTKLNDSLHSINTGSSYLQWPLENMSDTTFITSSTDTSIFKLLYIVEPSNTLLNIKKINPTILSFIKNTPVSLYYSLIKPAIIKPSSLLHVITKIESILILILMSATFIWFKKPNKKSLPIILFCIVTSLNLLVLIGFTTNTLGSLVRYKMPALLFLTIAASILIDVDKLKNLITKQKTS